MVLASWSENWMNLFFIMHGYQVAADTGAPTFFVFVFFFPNSGRTGPGALVPNLYRLTSQKNACSLLRYL